MAATVRNCNAGRQQRSSFNRRALALSIAIGAALMTTHAVARTEIALRFYDDNRVAQGAALSPVAQAVIEKTAGMPLVALGRDADGAYRFGFALEPSRGDVSNVLNKLRSTGAVVYADLVADERSTKHNAPLRTHAVTSLIVRLKSATTASAKDIDLKSRIGAKSGVPISRVRTIGDGSQVISLAAPLSPRDVEKVLQRLGADPDVAHVEIDRRARTQAQPSDPMYASQWNLTDPVGGIGAPRAWDITTGDANAPIAILDTGVLPHPDLAGRVVGGYDFVADVNFSNDGDGRDADATDPGDFVTDAEKSAPGSPLQGCSTTNSTWHGTMVAGTLGAAVNNGSGVSGVNWSSPLLNVRVMGKCGGALSDVADGIRWASGLAVPGVPANHEARARHQPQPRGRRRVRPDPAKRHHGGDGERLDHRRRGRKQQRRRRRTIGPRTATASSRSRRRRRTDRARSTRTRVRASRSPRLAAASAAAFRCFATAARTPPIRTAYGYGQQLGSSLAAPHVAGIASLVLAMNRAMQPAEVRALIESKARAFPTVSTDPCSTSLCGAGIADAAGTLAHLSSDAHPPVTPAPIPPSLPAPPTTPAPPPAPAPEPMPSEPPVAAAGVPSAARTPVPGGWQSKSPAEVARLQKEATLRVPPSESPQSRLEPRF